MPNPATKLNNLTIVVNGAQISQQGLVAILKNDMKPNFVELDYHGLIRPDLRVLDWRNIYPDEIGANLPITFLAVKYDAGRIIDYMLQNDYNFGLRTHPGGLNALHRALTDSRIDLASKLWPVVENKDFLESSLLLGTMAGFHKEYQSNTWNWISTPRAIPSFNYLVRDKRQNFASDDEFKKFVLYYLPHILWTNCCQDLTTLFDVLNRREVIIAALKREYGPLLSEEYILPEFKSNENYGRLIYLLNEVNAIARPINRLSIEYGQTALVQADRRPQRASTALETTGRRELHQNRRSDRRSETATGNRRRFVQPTDMSNEQQFAGFIRILAQTFDIAYIKKTVAENDFTSKQRHVISRSLLRQIKSNTAINDIDAVANVVAQLLSGICTVDAEDVKIGSEIIIISLSDVIPASFFDVIIGVYARKDLLRKYASEKTLVTALDGRYKPYENGSIRLKLEQLCKLRRRNAYSSPETGVDYTTKSCSFAHILSRDFDASMLAFIPKSALKLTNRSGETPLHWSSSNKNISTSRYILENAKETWSMKNIMSKRPVDVAPREFVDQLKEIYNEVNASPEDNTQSRPNLHRVIMAPEFNGGNAAADAVVDDNNNNPVVDLTEDFSGLDVIGDGGSSIFQHADDY